MAGMRGIFLIVIVLIASSLRAPAAENWPPVYHIPKLDNITIDGNGDDWKDQGFRIEVLAPADGQIVPSTEFDTSVRMGWCKEGLLLLISVVDQTPFEKTEIGQLARGDSVEIFASPDAGPKLIRYVFAPSHPENHSRIDDPYLRTSPSALKVAGRKTGAGYV